MNRKELVQHISEELSKSGINVEELTENLEEEEREASIKRICENVKQSMALQ